MTITINNQKFELTNDQVNKLKTALGLNGKQLSEVAIGETFKVADIEFIHFGNGVAVAKDVVFSSKFGKNNDFTNSDILKGLKKEILPKIEGAIGADNVLEFETDLLSLDGSDKYGVLKSKISLPTFDFYRKNVKIFDKYKLNAWWWLSTAWSTDEHYDNNYIECVAPIGDLYDGDYYGNFGVRPILTFVSSIFVTC